MWKVVAAVALGFSPLASAGELEQSVVVGAPKSQEFVASMHCEPQVCMDAFYRWSIAVVRSVSGPATPRRVKAIRVQHAENVFRENPPELLFALRPIADPAVRAKYGADYWVEALGRPATVFCLSGRTQEPDLSALELAGELRGSKCYAEPAP